MHRSRDNSLYNLVLLEHNPAGLLETAHGWSNLIISGLALAPLLQMSQLELLIGGGYLLSTHVYKQLDILLGYSNESDLVVYQH